jgi:hypothetical protein
MLSLNEAEYIQSAASLLAAARLLKLGLARRQTAPLCFLFLFAVSCLVLSSLSAVSAGYFRVFLICTVLNWVISIWVVRDMFRLSLERYPGIQTAARWTLYSSLILSALVSIGLTFSPWQGSPHGRTNLYYVELTDRVIVLTLAVIVAGLLFFLSRYPLHLSRNTYVSCGFFSVIFLSQAIADMIDSFAAWLYSIPFDTAEVLLGGALFLGWALLLRPDNVASPQRFSFDAPRETDLLRQLDSMNQVLSRVGRR